MRLKRLVFGILMLNAILSFGQPNPCNTLYSIYRSGALDKAFWYLESNTAWPCAGEKLKLLKAKVLIGNYRYNEARYELADLNSTQAIELHERLDYIAEVSSKRTGAELKIAQENSSGRNNLLLNIDGICLVDTQFILTEFPMTVMSEKAYFPKSVQDQKLAKWLYTQNLLEVLPGSSSNDSLGFITVRSRKPFQNNGSFYHISVIDLVKQKLITSWSPGDQINAIYPCIWDGRIIFASDKPGGMGGFDLWSATWDGAEFRDIENLGPEINSAADEIYPLMLNEQLVFASDRTDKSFGDFDLFIVQETGKIENLGLPLNSNANDLNPIAEAGRITSISSDRDSSALVLYNISYVDTTEVFAELLGRIEIEGLDLGGKYLKLTNQDSSNQRVIMLDKDGYFRINQLKGLDNYTVSISGLEMPDSAGRMVLYNGKGDLVADVKMNSYGVFAFALLKPEDYYLEKEVNEDESILAVDIKGLFESSANSEFVIALENSEGEIIGLTKTNEKGRFIFESVIPDDRYVIRTEVKNPNGLIRILNDKGEEIQTIHPEDQNGYVHLRLGENDRVITITDEENRAVKISELETFNLPTVYFGSDESELSAQNKNRLSGFLNLVQNNPNIQIEISGHTDSRGEKDYNLNLSQRRIDSVLQFLIDSGVNPGRITGKGYGESRLKNHCKDGTPCSEEEHAENRRTELRLYQNQPQLEP